MAQTNPFLWAGIVIAFIFGIGIGGGIASNRNTEIHCPICPNCIYPTISVPDSNSKNSAAIEPFQNLFKISWENYQREISGQWNFVPFYGQLKDFPFLAGEPFFSCPLLNVRIGGMDDGAKYICGPNFLPTEDCVVYSLGVSTNTKFEWALNKMVPQCKVFSFDPTPSLQQQYSKNKGMFPPTQIHHGEAVTGKEGVEIFVEGNKVKSRSLREIRKEYGHKEIHIFKVDIESGEYELFENLDDESWESIHQFQVEFHLELPGTSDKFYSLLKLFDKKGFVMFMKDANIYCPVCFEFSFLNVKKFAAKVGLDPSAFKTSLA